MAENTDTEIEQLINHLKCPHQTWLLGAGISCKAGIPLMIPLTEKVAQKLDGSAKEAFDEIRNSLHDNSHVEHVLSQLCDLITLAERTKDGNAQLNGKTYDKNALHNLHGRILSSIGQIIRCGYFPAKDGQDEQEGTLTEPIVKVEDHKKFISALFHKVRANLDSLRPSVNFFTTNYDTLLEDALALEKIESADCFTGGAMGYWNATFEIPNARAKIYKLHGSIDWYLDKQTRNVYRYRAACGYPARDEGKMLIYPQSTKYVETQKDPFAYLFSCFRKTLANSNDNALVVCGYSFGDEHINSEIEAALDAEKNKTTVAVFTYEGENGLPETLKKWLSNSDLKWKDRLFIATDKGLYRGNLTNLFPATEAHTWWTFQGLTELLLNGISSFGDIDE